MPPQTRVPSVSHVPFSPLDALPQAQAHPIAAAQTQLRGGRRGAALPAAARGAAVVARDAAGARRPFGRPNREQPRAETPRPSFGVERQAREEQLTLMREQIALLQYQNDLLVQQNDLLHAIAERLSLPFQMVDAPSSEDGTEAGVEAGAEQVGVESAQSDIVAQTSAE